MASDERDPDEVWRRLPRVNGLDSRSRAVARELAAWRERTAERENRPVGAVVRDPTVVELAKRTPASRKELAQIRGVNPDVVRRRGDDMLAAIERGRAAEPLRLDEAERLAAEPQDGPVIALAEALVRARAQEAGLAYELIAARADLAPIVAAAPRRARAGRPHASRLAPRAGRRRAARAAGRPPAAVGRPGRADQRRSALASTAVSGLSENRPSTPSSKNCSYSTNARPYSPGWRTCAARAAGTCSRCGTCRGGRAGRRGGRRGRSSSAPARTGRVARDDVVLRRADAVGVAGDLPQARRGGHVAVRAWVAADREVIGLAGPAGQQLHERHVDAVVEPLQVRDLERLDEHAVAAVVEVVAASGCGRAAPRAAARSSGSRSGAWSPDRSRSCARARVTGACERSMTSWKVGT